MPSDLKHIFKEFDDVSDAMLIACTYQEYMLEQMDRDSLIQLAQELADRYKDYKYGSGKEENHNSPYNLSGE